MSEKGEIKRYCYASKCGPVVITGFHHEQYPVCKACKQEISERLRKEIEDRVEPKDRNKSDDDGFDGIPW